MEEEAGNVIKHVRIEIGTQFKVNMNFSACLTVVGYSVGFGSKFQCVAH